MSNSPEIVAAQQDGAREGLESGPYQGSRYANIMERLAYTHGWRTGHEACSCRVSLGHRQNMIMNDLPPDL